ncbi:condensation domain-containing protein [Streptomyces sp. FXJ1.4098]|nr:condensation domain-containing protein [Streptomyces sp. FXJ1.4098]
MARHEALRTSFVEREPDGRPQQVIGEPWVPEVVHRAAEGATDEARLADARAALDALAQQPFDIASGRLLRVMLVDLAEDGRDQLLMCCLHHLVWDIGSEPVFLRDLERAYDECAGEAGQAAPYEEHPATPHQQRMAFVEHFERGTVYEDAPVYHNVSSFSPWTPPPARPSCAGRSRRSWIATRRCAPRCTSSTGPAPSASMSGCPSNAPP